MTRIDPAQASLHLPHRSQGKSLTFVSNLYFRQPQEQILTLQRLKAMILDSQVNLKTKGFERSSAYLFSSHPPTSYGKGLLLGLPSNPESKCRKQLAFFLLW